MPNLYLTYLDEDCGSLIASLSSRFQGLYPAYQLYWPIPSDVAPSMRDVILKQIEAVVVGIGPHWDRIADQFAEQRALQAMLYDLRQLHALQRPIIGIFYSRVVKWPSALRFLDGSRTLLINQQTDVDHTVISLHLKLQQIHR